MKASLVNVTASALILLMLLSSCAHLHSLSNEKATESVDDHIESAVEGASVDNGTGGLEAMVTDLQYLSNHPLNINMANENELAQIPGLSSKAARAIVRYRKIVKPFETIDELDKVKGIGKTTVHKIRPYITLGDQKNRLNQIYKDSRFWTAGSRYELLSRYQSVLQKPAGYSKNSGTYYRGNPAHYYQRMNYESHHISANITMDKDPGETMDDRLGFDYTSGSLAINDVGKLQELVLGDYKASFGQGLVLWSGSSFSKGSDVIRSTVRNASGIQAYHSSDENHFFRGLGLTYGQKMQVSLFLSDRNYSSSVIDGDTVLFPAMTGLYRTSTELARRYDNPSKMAGGHIAYHFPIGTVGVTGYLASFGKYIEKGSAIYQVNDFQGQQTSAIGTNFEFYPGRLDWAGEIAVSRNKAVSWITSLTYPLGNQTFLSLLYRDYSPAMHAIFGSGFGEQSGSPQNEQGIYVGLSKRWGRKITLSTYVDEYHFPGPRFGVNEPSDGWDWQARLTTILSSSLNIVLFGRYKSLGISYDSTDPLGRDIKLLGKQIRSSLRTQIEYNAQKRMQLRTRVEIVRNRVPQSTYHYGFLLSQDIRWYLKPDLLLYARIMEFDTDNYNTRIYEYENDLLYVMSDPAFFGQGRRSYLMLKYSPFRHLDIWAKYDVTTYENQNSIGSGLDRITGDRKSHIGIMVRWKW